MITYALISLGIIYMMNGCSGDSAEIVPNSAEDDSKVFHPPVVNGRKDALLEFVYKHEMRFLNSVYSSTRKYPLYKTIMENIAANTEYKWTYTGEGLETDMDGSYAIHESKEKRLTWESKIEHISKINKKIRTDAFKAGDSEGNALKFGVSGGNVLQVDYSQDTVIKVESLQVSASKDNALNVGYYEGIPFTVLYDNEIDYLDYAYSEGKKYPLYRTIMNIISEDPDYMWTYTGKGLETDMNIAHQKWKIDTLESKIEHISKINEKINEQLNEKINEIIKTEALTSSEIERLQGYYDKAYSIRAYKTIIEEVARPIGFLFGSSASLDPNNQLIFPTAQGDLQITFISGLDETAKHLYVKGINNKIETLAKEKGLE